MPAQRPHKYRNDAYRGDQPFAFVSYAHEDSAEVFAEMDALAAAGIRFYYDEGIHPGHRWHDELAGALERCAVFVFFVTPRSVDSRNCQDEIEFVLDRNKPVIAVHLEDTELPAGMRLAIGSRQAIVRSRFDEQRYRERLVAAIREHVGGAAGDEPAAVEGTVPQSRERAPAKRTRSAWLAGASALLLLAAGYGGFTYWRHAETARVERDETLAKIEQLVQQDQYGAAFALAHPLMAEKSAGDDARLQALWQQIVVPGTPLAADAGATLSYKPYADDGDWIVAGVTPIETVLDLPKGVVRVRLEKPGFQTGDFVIANPGPSVKLPQREFLKDEFSIPDVPLVLAPEGKLPSDMVLVPATNMPVYLSSWTPSLTGDFQREVPAFAIARFEVTNREFKEFVDAGGYDNAAYWDGLEFRDEGRVLAWPDARARFVDRTGRLGPAGWELSSYPAGQAELPVGGISWYEAVAYARFRHLSLPTIHHWTRAAFAPYEGLFETAPAVGAVSRFRADDPVAARSELGIGPWGTFNTAGNVREWVWNSVGDLGVALGGAWHDEPVANQEIYATRPMDRSADLGLRLMQPFDAVPGELLAPITLPYDSAFAHRAPVSDDAFDAMRFQFTAGHRNPSSVHVEQFAQSDAWTAEEVVLEFGADAPLSLYIVRPRGSRAALQPVLYGPPADPFDVARPNRNVLEQLRTADVVVSGGRALVIPIWSGTYQRAWARPTDAAGAADLLRRAALAWYQDAATALDYLATREDFDRTGIGYMGMSFGSVFMAGPVLALDGRVRAAVLASSGVWLSPIHPMIDVVNYAPRIHLPVLMINGRYDSVLPYELSQVRLFDLLGTAAADKRQVLFDVSHFTYPHSQLAKEVNDWFDKYLGPVK